MYVSSFSVPRGCRVHKKKERGRQGRGLDTETQRTQALPAKKSRTGQTGGRAEQAEVSVCLSVRPLVVTSLCFSVGLSPSVCRSVYVSVSVRMTCG